MENTTTSTETSLHYHCGIDCYRLHRKASGKCANVGHYDYSEPCLFDCRDNCAANRESLML